MSNWNNVTLLGEMYALYEFPNEVFDSRGEVGTMRCGNWKTPPEISVGQEDIAEVVCAAAATVVDDAVGIPEDEGGGRPNAEQLNPPVLSVTLSQPVVFFNASLKIL